MAEVGAVIFDMDGVITDSEQIWTEVRAQVMAEFGHQQTPEEQRAMMGMSSREWPVFMADCVGKSADAETMHKKSLMAMSEAYEQQLPLIPGAVEVVRVLSKSFTLGLASSSDRELIELALKESNLSSLFSAVTSSEEVAQGKPNPDVYLETARRLNVDPKSCVAIEDSTNGVRSAQAAKMTVICVPNVHYPPDPKVLKTTSVVKKVTEVTADLIQQAFESE